MHRWLEVGWYAPQYQKHRIREASLQFYIDIRMMFQGRINDFFFQTEYLVQIFLWWLIPDHAGLSFGCWFDHLLIFFPLCYSQTSFLDNFNNFNSLKVQNTTSFTSCFYFIKKTQKRPRIKTTKKEGLKPTNPSRLGAKVLELQLWVSWGHRLRAAVFW